MNSLRQVIVAVLALLLVGAAAAAHDAAYDAAQRGAVPAGPPLQVDGFDVERVTQLSTGTPLVFSLFGTPGASASLQIDGAARRLVLPEVQPGVYEGRYLIGSDDRITATSRVSAQLRLADQAAAAVLDEPLLLGAVSARVCDDCGVVESIRSVDEPRAPGATGAIAGGLIGALVGSQFGKGDGRTVGGLLGALGGAYAGRAIERQHARRTRYEVVVRWPGGTTQARRYDSAPSFRVGDRVRRVEGTWQAEAAALPY